MTSPEFEPMPKHHTAHLEGESLAGVDQQVFKNAWKEHLHSVVQLVARNHDIVFEGRDHEGEHVEVHFPVVADEDNHGKQKVIISLAAAAAMVGLGYALFARGRYSPKARNKY